MPHPSLAQYYCLPQPGTYRNLVSKQFSIPKPSVNEVLVKVHAVSLQYRDIEVSKGQYSGVVLPHDLVPCSDMAGEIVAIGEDVHGWKLGDRVCSNFSLDHIYGDTTPEALNTALGGAVHGVLTEYRTFPPHSLLMIPGHLSYEEASTLPCAAVTAYNALFSFVPLKAGDYVLVLGSGGVSIFGLQIAVAAGATVIATSSSDDKLKVVSRLGAKHVINYKTTPDWDKEILRITNGVGVDHVIEVGGLGTLPTSINATRIGGYLHIIGYVSDQTVGTNLVFPIIRRAITLRGMEVGPVTSFKGLNRLLVANPETTRPVIDRIFPFDEAVDAFAYLESQQHVGKVVIKVS